MFTNGAGEYFIGTAGHCGNVGDQVTMLYLPGGLVDIGNVILSTGDAGIGNDFALIKIKPELYGDVSPSLAYWGGPTGVYWRQRPRGGPARGLGSCGRHRRNTARRRGPRVGTERLALRQV